MTIWDVRFADGAVEPCDSGRLRLRRGWRVQLEDGRDGWVHGKSRAPEGSRIARRLPADPSAPAPSFGVHRPPGHLQRAEIRRLAEARGGPSFSARRDRALIVLLWRTGLRCAEALDLVPDDLDLERMTVWVRRGKGGKSRTVGFDAQTAEVLRLWLTQRPANAVTVFCSRQGTRMSSAYVRAMIKRAAARAGITRRVHPHALRHTFAVELAEEGVPGAKIQQLLGHESLATTTIYLASLSPEDALDYVRRRKW